jgi:AraC-like DNA-binding protein
LDSARIYLERGLTLNNRSNSSYKDSNLNWFDEVSIEIDYYSGNFQNVIIKSDILLGKKNSTLSESSVFNLNIFKGLSSLQLNDLRPGIRFLNLADSLYDLNNFSLQPYQRELFEQLLNYHKSNGNNDEQIKYLNKLIDTDSIFKINYQYFEPTIIKNFETPWLIREKEVLIKDLEAQNKTSQYIMYVSCVLSVFMLFFLVHLIYLKFRDKKRFLLLLAESTNKGGHFKKTSQKPEIGDEIIDELLKRLDQFERDEKFLSQSISLQKLAVTFKTNTKYLSNIINHEKDKSFPHYINDLRVDFALKEITENSKFRKYTIKAIAGDCGFNSAESFSKAFKKRHKVAASYFIKELEKLKKGP